MPELKDVKRLATFVCVIVGLRLPTVFANASLSSADVRFGGSLDVIGVVLVATRVALRATARHRMSQ